MNIKSVTPVYQDNYDQGWIGFTFNDDNFVSQGIAWFTRPDMLLKDPAPVSHVLVVTGFNECVEALPQGVVRSDLRKYFEGIHTHIFFRKPRGYSLALGEKITDAAEARIGHRYGYGLILANALAGSIGGRILNRLLFNLPHRLVSGFLNGKRSQICSELAARCLQEVGLTAGCLELPARMITPRMLAWDPEIWIDLKAQAE